MYAEGRNGPPQNGDTGDTQLELKLSCEAKLEIVCVLREHRADAAALRAAAIARLRRAHQRYALALARGAGLGHE